MRNSPKLICIRLSTSTTIPASSSGKEHLEEVISILTRAMEECFGDLREIDLDAVVERNKKQRRYVGVRLEDGDIKAD